VPFNDLLQANGVRLTETSAYLAGQDPDYADNMRHGFRRLSKVQNDRDLLPIEQQRMIEIALFLYDSNPLAKRLIDLVNSFVTGDGFTFSAKHPKVLDILTRFWEDPVNDWPLKQLERFKMLSLLGEVLWPVAVRRTDGRVRMGYVDPANIEEIIPDPYNPEIVRTAVIRQGYTVDGVTDLPTRYSLINVDERLDSPAYGKLNYYPEPYGAFYFAINKPPNATRGRSDLITIFDWLDIYDQLLFGSSERATYLTDFVWDVTMKGADEDTLRKWFRENSIPRGAAMRVHNENVTWQAISPNLQTFDIDMMARLIKQHILTAMGIPPTWVSDPGDTNRSVGVTMAGPVLKSLTHRQRIAKAILTKILQFVIDQAVLAGTLQLPPEDRRFEVLAPSLTPSDMSALTNTMLRLVQAVKLAEDQRWISHETAAKVFLKTLSELGVQIAVEDELTKIMDLIRQRLQQEAAMQVELQQQQSGSQQAPETGTSTSVQPPRVEVPRAPKMTGPRLPRSATGSELQSPEEQQANQLAGQAVTGEMTTRKGNPAG
jgi:hypothetical protein